VSYANIAPSRIVDFVGIPGLRERLAL
jgi:hypothetical protein